MTKHDPRPRTQRELDRAEALARSWRVRRDATIIDRRDDGETLESIAKDYGLTRERVRQIISEMAQKASRK